MQSPAGEGLPMMPENAPAPENRPAENAPGNAASETPKETPKETPREAPKADAFALYRKKGRSWTTKNTSKFGDMENVSFTKTEVVDSGEAEATLRITSMDKDMKPLMDPMEQKISFKTEAPKDGQPAEGPKVEDGGEVEAAGKKWATTKTTTDKDGTKTVVWMAKDMPGLVIRMEMEMAAGKSSSELTEFIDG
jgi:hypothetical protein